MPKRIARRRRRSRKLKLVIIGTGDMGGAIATAFAKRSKHDVAVRGSRPDSRSATALVRTLGVALAGAAAVSAADVVFLVVPWSAWRAAAGTLADYRGIVVSVIVPEEKASRRNLTSAAERVAKRLPRARVVGAFTSIWSTVMRDPGPGTQPSAIVCSDDRRARNVVMSLAREIGLDAVNGGPLASTRYTEGLGMLAYALAVEGGYGQRVSFRVFVADRP